MIDLRESLTTWRERGEAFVGRAIEIAPGLDLGLELAHRFVRLNGSVLVGHLAYRAFTWMIPLLLVAVGLLGYGTAEGLSVVQWGRDAGLDEATLQTAADETSDTGLTVMIVGLMALVIATRSLVRGLFLVYSQIWEVDVRRPRRIVRAIGVTLVGGILVVAILGAITALSGRGPVLLVTSGLAGVALTGAVVLTMSWVLPHRAGSILGLVPGSAVAVIGVVGLNVFGGLYFPQRLSDASATYGSVGFALVFLFFLWLIAFLIVASAFVNAVWCDRADILDGRPWVAAPELLPDWLRRLYRRITVSG